MVKGSFIGDLIDRSTGMLCSGLLLDNEKRGQSNI